MRTKVCDVAIIGGGGAGMTAALYTSRADLSTVLFEKLMPGGQIASTDLVENYPGFPEGILGPEIAQRMEAQAKRYGAEILYEEVRSISKKGDFFEVAGAEGSYQARTVILAMGASFRTLGLPREKELTGKGVSYCATCDGAFFRGKTVVVVGGGDSALQEGLFLTRFASKVTIIHRRDQLRASPILQARAKANPKMDFIWDTVIEKIEGAQKVEGVSLRNVKTGIVGRLSTDAVFVFVGHDPNSALVKGFVDMDEKGYVLTGASLKTSVSGVFAAGEIRKGAVKQLVAACGDGCEAALAAQAYLDDLS
ncbi:MAG TPA: thioredoxin-disulfide reductase [Candidatus Omnitrophota bacterium]|nr:thioredoxin-disulfide reductase [Candidatus Omnitrophota bacterium]HPS36468.1 thioredoxin-disulfide reductase [Candidatus Omnitrophota bacterium]